MLQRLGRALARLLLFALFTPPLALAGPPEVRAASTIVIGEVAWAGSSLSTADEWLELWNLGDTTSSLAGWRLTGAGGTNGMTFREDDAIPPHGTFLIANYAADDAKSVLAAAPNVVTTTLALANDKLDLRLVDGQDGIVDAAGAGQAPPAGSSLPVKISMVRNGDVWASSVASDGLDPGVTDLGTPGSCDGCLAPEAPPIIEPDPIPVSEPEPEPATSAMESMPVVEPPATTTIAEIAVPTEPEPQYPEIQLSVHGTFEAGVTIVFNAASSSDPNGDPLTFTWAFGDGTVADGPTVTHAYAESNAYDFILTASDGTFRGYATGTLEIEPPPPPPLTLTLNEIHPAPKSGAEWVELYGVAPDQLARLDGWTLADKTGTVYRFTASTTGLLANGGFLTVHLSSARLNNGGDTVFLKRPDGSVADALAYGKTPTGVSWERLPNGTGPWTSSHLPTPGTENASDPTQETVAPTPELTIERAAVEQSADQSSETLADIATVTLAPETSTVNDEAEPEPTLVKTKPAKKTPAPTTPKLMKAKKVKTIPAVKAASIPMTSTLVTKSRVSLSGTVATTPGLLAKNQFILLNPDGRGLLVKGNGKQKTPVIGTTVRVTGELASNDDGANLVMRAADTWSANDPEAPPLPRLVDLLAPLTEDAWSLIEVTGTVRETRASAIMFDTGDAELTVTVKPASRYRAQRLSVGDVILVRGLLDLRGEDPKVLIRQPEDVALVSHAPPKEASGPPPSDLPPWTPFGAAGLTVALTHGYRRLQKLREQRRLERLLREASESISSS